MTYGLLLGALTIASSLSACSAARVTPPAAADAALGSEIIIASRAEDEEEDPVPSWDGERYLVVWQSTRRGPTDIYGTWITANGEVAVPDGFPISEGPSDGLFPDVEWGATSHLVVWQDLRSRRNWEIYAARIARDGAVLDPDGIAVGIGRGNRRHPRVAWSGREFLVVWMQERPEAGWDIAAARVTADGAVLDPGGIAVTHRAGDQARPAVTWNGEAFLVAWMDTRDGATDIYGARVASDGRVLDPDGIAVSTASGEQGYPAVAWNGRETVVVWVDRRGEGTFALYGARLNADGRVVDPEGRAISATPRLHMFPAVACREPECLVVWEEQTSGSTMARIVDIVRDVRAVRWRPDGRLGPPFSVAPGALGNHFSAVIADGRGYFVVWKDYRSGLAGGFGRFVEPR